MACLYCGKDIGPFRLLRDTEFCCTAHRQGYKKRLGKALDRISAHEPPPAPPATFIPYKPFAGNNFALAFCSSLDPYRPAPQLLSAWPLSIVPLPRERAAPLPLLQPRSLGRKEFSAQPEPWMDGSPVRRPGMELDVEDRLPVFEAEAEEEPVAPGPEPFDVSAADWLPGAESVPDMEWSGKRVWLPDESPRPARARCLQSCGPAPGLLAEAVEAFLPPGPQPEMQAYAIPAATISRWTLRAADWAVVGDLAAPAAAPAAQAVEAFLPSFTEPQIVAWPAAAALPQLTIAAADWAMAAAVADPVAAPAAEAVEAFLPPFAEPQMVAWPAAATLPQLTIAAADWTIAADMADPVAAPAAEAVEAFLPPPAEPQIVTWPAVAVALPRLSLDPAAWSLSVDLAEAVAAPGAQAVESFLPPPAEPQIATWPAAAATLPRLALDPTDWVLTAEIAEPVSAPAAQAVESFLPAAEPQIAAWPAAACALPRLTVAAADWTIAAAIAEPANAPAAEVVESLLPLAKEPCAIPFQMAALRVPELALTAIAPEPVEEFVAPLVIADACENWMPGAPACEVVREVVPACAGELPAAAAIAMPAAMGIAMEQPTIRWAGDWRPSATAEPVVSHVAPHLETVLPMAFALTAPSSGELRKAAGQHAQNLAAPAVERYPEASEPSQAGAPAIAASYQQSGSRHSVLRFPAFTVEHATGNRAAPFQEGVVSAAEPAVAEPNAGATPRLDLPSAVHPPAFQAVAQRCGLPLAKPVNADFVCQRTPMAPTKSLESIQPRIAVQPPKFVVRPLFERVEEAVAPPKPVEKTPSFAEIFAISKAPRRRTASNGGLFSAGKLIAASLIVGLSMWIGAGGVKITKQMLAVNAPFRGMASTPTPSGVDTGTASPARGIPSRRSAEAKAPGGPIASVRRAIQQRAAVELTDTFRRMEAWGSNAMTLPAGWTRHPDGYVRTGQLALYRPAQTFADYHFEFFGEIEKKSMSWAVRARDTQNYYGMKMTVIEPGLRPVMAVVHYAVVGGKKGQRVETPLSMMMHNNEPYHVAVDVKGNRVVTSIEGQEVDSWTDDALKVGGIGFFSEMGESARLYWMRVTKNQDWLGRVCAYLSSGSGTDTADVWRDEVPHAPTQPSQPAPPPAVDVTLAAAEETEDLLHIGPQRARISKYGRTEQCRS